MGTKNKREFMSQAVKYLGYTIRPEGILLDLNKAEALKNYAEILKNTKRVRGFLGLVGYYRQLAKNFNKKVKPLHDLLRGRSESVYGSLVMKPVHDLLRGRSEVEWKPSHSQAVGESEEALENAVMTKIVDPAFQLC